MALLFAAVPLSAHFGVYVKTGHDDGLFTTKQCPFSPVQLGIIPESEYKLQFFSGETEIFGPAFSLCALSQESAAVSFAPILNGLKKNYFLQTAVLCTTAEANYGISTALLWNHIGDNYGLSAGLLNTISEFGMEDEWHGIQLGLFNAGGSIQFGLLNYNPNALLPWFPILNFSCP